MSGRTITNQIEVQSFDCAFDKSNYSLLFRWINNIHCKSLHW